MDRKFLWVFGVPLILIFVFSVIASSKLLVNKFYTSHDGEEHVIRLIEFDQALRSDGQFPVRIARRINYGLGYPFFNFNYPLIYYLGEGVHLIGFSYVDSFKILMFGSVLTGAIFMYLLTYKYFGKAGAFASALFWIIAPYRFLDMYVRGDVAESMGLSIIPLLLWSTDNFINKNKYGKFYLIFSFSILTLSHNITAMLGIVLSVLYLLFKLISTRQKITLIKGYILSLFAALLLSAFFWFPAIYESSLTKLVELTEDYVKFFPTLPEIIYSPWGFGFYKQGVIPGRMSPQIGVIHELIFVIALMFFIRVCLKSFSCVIARPSALRPSLRLVERDDEAIPVCRQAGSNRLGLPHPSPPVGGSWFAMTIKEKDRLFLFFAVVSLVSIFLSLEYSKFLWDNLYFLKLVQLPWRFIGFAVLGFSIAAGYIVSQINLKSVKILSLIILTMLLIYSNRNHIRVNQYVDFNNPFLTDQVYGPSTTSKDEHMPKDAPRIYQAPNQNGDVFPSLSGSSKRIVWKSNYHLFEVDLKTAAGFRDNTSYFPGWSAKIDGADAKINYQIDEFKRLRISLPSGKHKVEFFFSETNYRKFADLVSLITFLSLIFYYILTWKKFRSFEQH